MYSDTKVSKCADCDRLLQSDHTAIPTTADIPVNTSEQVFRAINSLGNTIDTMNEEVIQSPCCPVTDGMHSVNSAETSLLETLISRIFYSPPFACIIERLFLYCN